MAGKQKQAFMYKEETSAVEEVTENTIVDITGKTLNHKDTILFPHILENGTATLGIGVIHDIFTKKDQQYLRLISISNPSQNPEKIEIQDRKNENIIKLDQNLPETSTLHTAYKTLNP